MKRRNGDMGREVRDRSRDRDEDHPSQRSRVENLADAIKAGQRASSSWKEAWRVWATQGPPTKDGRGPPLDPARHEEQALRSFLESVSQAYLQSQGQNCSGGTPYREVNREHTPTGTFTYSVSHNGQKNNDVGVAPVSSKTSRDMIEFIKMGQKSRTEFRDLWSEHCDTFGEGTKDPSKHDNSFFVSFAFRYGISALGSESWSQPFLAALAKIAIPLLVESIKTGQRYDNDWKSSWIAFCDIQAAGGQGTYDPQRQDGGSLLEFMETVGLRNFPDKPWCQVFVSGKKAAHFIG